MGILDAMEILLCIDEDKMTDEEREALNVIYGLLNEVVTGYMEEHNIGNSAPLDEEGNWAVDEEGAVEDWV